MITTDYQVEKKSAGRAGKTLPEINGGNEKWKQFYPQQFQRSAGC